MLLSSFPSRRRRGAGFTFLEIMMVVVIIGILAAVVAPRLVGRTKKAKEAATKLSLQGIQNAIKQYEMDMGSFPKKLTDLYEEQDKPWDGPYIDDGSKLTDAFGEEFVYKSPGDHNKRGFDLASKGDDKQENTEDDIVNWRTEEKK